MADNSAAADFTFNALGLGSVLKLHRLGVPLYQREYSWPEDVVDQLLLDLAKARDDGQGYFLGTVVTIPSGNNADKLDVVDGQQRLTTTAILLAEIRDYIRKFSPNSIVVESIENEFLTTIDRKRGERVPRLELNIDDRMFFNNLINRSPNRELLPTRESHRKLTKAKRKADSFVSTLLATFDSTRHIEVLNDWLEFIEKKATVILLKAPDSSHAFRMFETLNDRGLKTSQADLVKNYLFGEAGDRVHEAQARWSAMLSTLEDIDDADRSVNFLRHCLIATRAFTRTDRVYATVQRQVNGEVNALQFLSDLERLSRLYVATYQPDADHWIGYPERARSALRTLRLLDMKPFRPMILSIAERLSVSEAALALKFLVAIGVRSIASGRINSGQFEQVSAAAALAIYRREITSATELKSALGPIALPNAEFFDRFKTMAISKPPLARYILRALEATGLDAEPEMVPNNDPAEITLEHILPKTPIDEGWNTFSSDDVKIYSRRLGNMCLLQRTSNSNARSDRFSDKRDIYKASTYRLTSEVGALDDWTLEAINQRQHRLADIALRTWPI